jgi:hypothetical protein
VRDYSCCLVTIVNPVRIASTTQHIAIVSVVVVDSVMTVVLVQFCILAQRVDHVLRIVLA